MYALGLSTSAESSAAAAIASRNILIAFIQRVFFFYAHSLQPIGTLNAPSAPAASSAASSAASQLQSPVDRLKALKARRTMDASSVPSSAAAAIGTMSLEQLRARVTANSAQSQSQSGDIGIDEKLKENSTKFTGSERTTYFLQFHIIIN